MCFVCARLFVTPFWPQIVCDLVEAKGKSGLPPGVLPILDDVCRTMHARSGNEGLDEKFVETGA